jgi:hypothetical protein
MVNCTCWILVTEISMSFWPTVMVVGLDVFVLLLPAGMVQLWKTSATPPLPTAVDVDNVYDPGVVQNVTDPDELATCVCPLNVTFAPVRSFTVTMNAVLAQYAVMVSAAVTV